MSSSYGRDLRLTIFGQSHSAQIGMTLEGIPAGETIDLQALQAFLNRRAPRDAVWSTARREADIPQFLTGIAGGKTCGEAITAVIANQNARSGDYTAFSDIPRPGHADYTAYIKYGGAQGITGGGHFSGRMTAPLCVAGGICLQLLAKEGITVISRIAKIGGIPDEGDLCTSTAEKIFPTVSDTAGEKMQAKIAAVRAEGDSVGGEIEVAVLGLPAGLGEHMFDGMENRISSLVFGIPAVKGIAFGEGFGVADLRGSESNDAFAVQNGKIITTTNRCGGILGGMTDGMPLTFRTAVKPTPSIAKRQQSVNLKTMRETVLSVGGRHDACIVPRAVPCMEAAAAIAVYDAILAQRRERAKDLQGYRAEIDRTDAALTRLFCRRMAISKEIAAYKKEHTLPVLDASREGEKLAKITAAVPEELRDYTASLYRHLFSLSRDYQMAQRKTGLLGGTLGHSYSSQIHALLGDAHYALFPCTEAELPAFLQGSSWDALNVTIPYKKAVMPYCDEITDTARKIGSVNTLTRDANGKIHGDNTDYFGFLRLVQKSGVVVAGQKAVVLGSGGASAAVCAVLHDMGAKEIAVISRRGEDNYETIARHGNADLMVNATPLGMYPHNGESTVDLTQFPRCKAVFDLIYNPLRTALLLQAETLGIPYFDGLYMLAAQAKRSREIFTGTALADDVIDTVEKQMRLQMQNIILVGMPGAGKSTVAELLAARLGRKAVDSDAEIIRRIGMPIADYFAQNGEEAFRRVESEVLAELGKQSGLVIATGGGCVTREENYPLLHQNGTIIWLRRNLKDLSVEARPLSQARSAEELYRERADRYARFADMQVENTAAVVDAVCAIEEKLL